MCYDDSFESGGFECLCDDNNDIILLSRELKVNCADCGAIEDSKTAWTRFDANDNVSYICNPCGNKYIKNNRRG